MTQTTNPNTTLTRKRQMLTDTANILTPVLKRLLSESPDQINHLHELDDETDHPRHQHAEE